MKAEHKRTAVLVIPHLEQSIDDQAAPGLPGPRDVAGIRHPSEHAITEDGRKAVVGIMERGGGRPACPLGDEAAERRLHEAYTEAMTRLHGPPPSGRTARRIFKKHLDRQPPSTREYRRQIDRDVPASPGGASDDGEAADRPKRHAWLPDVGRCLMVDGSRIVASAVTGGAPFHRLDDGGGDRNGFVEGRAIATRVRRQRASERALGEATGSDLTQHRRMHPRVFLPEVGDRVRVGGRHGVCLGQTVTGRVAVAMDGQSPAATGRRIVKTYPAGKVKPAPTVH